MEQEVLKIVAASFVSGMTGAIIGAIASVAAMRVEIRWIKDQLTLAHARITKVNDKIDRLVSALRKRIDDTRDIILKNMP